MATETVNSTWNKILQGIFAMPGIAVDRNEFLKKQLQPLVDKKVLSATQLSQVIDDGYLVEEFLGTKKTEQMASSVINNHTMIATSVSTISGIPGGFTMAATIPADLVQYYFNVFVVAQKLAYFYGYPDLRDESGKLSDTAANVLTVFVGIMAGVSTANQAMKVLSHSIAREAVKQLPKYALTKTLPYQLVKRVAMEIGVLLTKRSFTLGVSRAIPIVGGIVSGVITWASFRPQAKKLLKTLQNDEIRP